MGWTTQIAAVLRTLHWRRGLRAGFAVATAMVVCRLLGKPMGWAALGGFEAVLVDNGGPYRSRMHTVFTVLFGGAVCGIIGTLVPQALLVAALCTAAVCFAVTFARVASQPIASTAVIILVIYFAGYGSSERTLDAAIVNVTAYVLGGLWAGVLGLFLWPVDPFRPARLEVAACYDLLAAFTARIHAAGLVQGHIEHDDDHAQAVELKRQLRAKLESARAALGATPARAPARTHRARNLSVLLETADMLYASTVRLTEMAEILSGGTGPATLDEIAHWLSGAERAIAEGLTHKPADGAASFGPEGSHRIQFVTRQAAVLATHARPAGKFSEMLPHLIADERDELQNVDIAFDALRAIWTGYDAGPAGNIPTLLDAPLHSVLQSDAEPGWIDALRQNWTLDSLMMRHALRMAAVGAVDVLLMRAVHVSHGFWLAMTSIIVLQPQGSGTLRKSLQRVGGTIAGGILAALLAAWIHSYTGIVIVITACSVLTLATYAIDYGWYSFFLTPTFVLLSLPYLRDWRYAGLRIVTTMLGALTAVAAMRLLWPESLTVELRGLLARSASAVAAYLRATLTWWAVATVERKQAERQFLAPARRACGLTSQDAEEALDRALLDPMPGALHLGHRSAPTTESALTFTTYTRRFTQCLTTLASVGVPTPETVLRLDNLITRLEGVSTSLAAPAIAQAEPKMVHTGATPSEPSHFDPTSNLAEQMLQRMERQAGVLERAAASIT